MSAFKPTHEGLAVASAGLLVLLALGLGADPQGGFDTAIHVAALPALGLAIWRWRTDQPSRWQMAMLAVSLAAIAIALLQLLPIPVGVYENLPGRRQVIADLRSAGLAPAYLPLSLDRWATLRTLLALSTFTAMWMLCTTLRREARVRLVKLAIVAALPLVLLGFAQASLKRDTTGAMALFSNRNHFASLMAMLVPLALAAAREAAERENQIRSILWLSTLVLLLLASALSFSRAGFALACLALLATLWVNGAIRHATRSTSVIAALAIAFVAIATLASDRLGARFNAGLGTDLRWQFLANGQSVLASWLPWGSGFGTFPTVYGAAENMQSLGEFTGARYAHNEILQTGIESGWPGLLVLAVFVGLLIAAAASRLRHTSDASMWARAAVISVAVPLAHSLVDYPLRTFACSIVLALLVSIVLPSRRRSGQPAISPRQ